MTKHDKITVRDRSGTQLPYGEKVECRCGEWEETHEETHVAHVIGATVNEGIAAIDGLITEVTEEVEGSETLDDYLFGLGDAISTLEGLCSHA